jgi:hypothetical protein
MMRVQERIMPKKPRNDAIDQKLKEKFTRGAQHFEVACRQLTPILEAVKLRYHFYDAQPCHPSRAEDTDYLKGELETLDYMLDPDEEITSYVIDSDAGRRQAAFPEFFDTVSKSEGMQAIRALTRHDEPEARLHGYILNILAVRATAAAASADKSEYARMTLSENLRLIRFFNEVRAGIPAGVAVDAVYPVDRADICLPRDTDCKKLHGDVLRETAERLPKVPAIEAPDNFEIYESKLHPHLRVFRKIGP